MRRRKIMTTNKTLELLGCTTLIIGGVRYAAIPSSIRVEFASPSYTINSLLGSQLRDFNLYTQAQIEGARLATPIGVYRCTDGEFIIDELASLAESVVYSARYLGDRIPEWMAVQDGHLGNGVSIEGNAVTSKDTAVVCRTQLCTYAVAIYLGAAW